MDNKTTTKYKFVIVSEEWSGVGWAKRLQEEGHTVMVAFQPNEKDIDYTNKKRDYALVGKGIIDRYPLSEVLARRSKMKDWYWIWDANHNPDINEKLRKEGFKVLMGSDWNFRMEHDRDFTLKLAEKYGLKSPNTTKFTDGGAAISFLQSNPEIAYVYKPDEGEKYETYVPTAEEPIDANKELQTYLTAVKPHKPFILQEMKQGIEINVEVWFQNGQPCFAFMNFEAKRKDEGDRGELAGCAFDFGFVIPCYSKIVMETVGKLFPVYDKMKYTGFGDVNVIVAADGIWFFEKCERFGYNAHPNLLFTLNKDELGKTFVDLIENKFTPNFSKGFGASVTMHNRHPHSGLPIMFPEKYEKDIYFYSAYKEKGAFLTSGYYEDVLCVTAFGYTIPTAWEAVMAKANKIKFPGVAFRDDGDKTNYPSSPIRRYEAMVAMGYI